MAQRLLRLRNLLLLYQTLRVVVILSDVGDTLVCSGRIAMGDTTRPSLPAGLQSALELVPR